MKRTCVTAICLVSALVGTAQASEPRVESAPQLTEGAPSAPASGTPDLSAEGAADDTSSPSGPEDKAAPPPDPALLKRQIDAAMRQLADEPSLQVLEEATLRLADAHAEGAKRWHRTPRLSAMLPTLKIAADYGIGRDESLDRYQDDPDRWGADTDRAMGFEASAQWQLGELVFNADEVRVYNALADRAARREELLNLIIGYYFERRRLQLENLLVPPADLTEALEREIRIHQLTASIDALTGGLLSRTLNRKATLKP